MILQAIAYDLLKLYVIAVSLIFMNVGAGSTLLHFAACGGNLKCCQVLTPPCYDCIVIGCLPIFLVSVPSLFIK